MLDGVTPITIKQSAQIPPSDASPRHRRAGHFDADDQWHDDAEPRLTVTG